MTSGDIEARTRVGEKIGAGAVTSAFRATLSGPEGFEKPVVWKVTHKHLDVRPDFGATLFVGLLAAADLVHANVVPVLDSGMLSTEHGRGHYLVTEYVDGIDLGTIFERTRECGAKIPLSVVAYVIEEIAKALDHAHRRRKGAVFHGGLSPSNVLVSFRGEVKVSDFGMHDAVRAAGVAPDPRRAVPYRSPEALRGEGPSVASDVFALGAIADEASTLEAPFFCGGLDETRPIPSLAHDPTSPIESALAALAPRLTGPPEARPTAAEVHDALFSARSRSVRGEPPATELARIAMAARDGWASP
jgi:serine/threonine protein kinase